MYTGHLGVALAARRFGTVPLWALVVTSQMPDWLSIVVGATGVEDAHEIWSHSLPAVLIGAAVAGCITLWVTARPGSAALIAAVYLSHPVLDLITGLKPTWPAGPLIGGCLYDWPVGDFIVESLFVLAGAAVYRTCIDPARRTAAVGGIVAVVLLCQLGADATQAHRLNERHGTADAASFFAGRRCQ
jgi:LexA-binding, inner membrane-associated putative hydrolase